MIVDTHCHFDMMPQPEAYIRFREKAGDIVIGMTNLPSHFQMGQPYLNGYKHIRLALGVHPLRAVEGKTQLALFRKLVDQTSYIGEIGLDFSREGVATKDVQLEVLRDVLSAIRGKKKVVSVHSRKAEKDLLELFCEYEIENVIFHWYSGSVDLIPAILEQGYYFSVNEAMCLSKNGRAIIEKIPQDRLLTETDAPYNDKANIEAVLKHLNISEQVIFDNFKGLLACLKQSGRERETGD